MHNMASTHREVIVLERCRVSPPPGAVVGKSLPLTFFDVLWIQFPPVHCLLFYEFPYSRDHFNETIVPNLKHSLSLALKHFFPFAGNLVIFSSSTSRPEIRYVDGDSVSVTFAECTNDFNYLTGKIPRNVDDFFPLTPQLPPSTNAADTIIAPLLALQVTLFPNYGICIGITRNHVVGDASTMVGFIRAWALITKLGSEEPLVAGGSLPFYDRTVIGDPQGLYDIYRSQMGNIYEPQGFQTQHRLHTRGNNVRASFVIGRADIQRLKSLVLATRTNLAHVSSFAVACAYVWSCMAKLRVVTGEEMHEDELEHFMCAADCRARLDPPIPTTYFGNCILGCFATAKSTQLMAKEGFLTGAELIGEGISNMANNKEGVLKGAETLIVDIKAKKEHRVLDVVGSPKFSLHDIDFGWKIPKKFEIGFNTTSMSLNGCKEGGLEIGLSFPNDKMDAFANIFTEGLKI